MLRLIMCVWVWVHLCKNKLIGYPMVPWFWCCFYTAAGYLAAKNCSTFFKILFLFFIEKPTGWLKMQNRAWWQAAFTEANDVVAFQFYIQRDFGTRLPKQLPREINTRARCKRAVCFHHAAWTRLHGLCDVYISQRNWSLFSFGHVTEAIRHSCPGRLWVQTVREIQKKNNWSEAVNVLICPHTTSCSLVDGATLSIPQRQLGRNEGMPCKQHLCLFLSICLSLSSCRWLANGLLYLCAAFCRVVQHLICTVLGSLDKHIKWRFFPSFRWCKKWSGPVAAYMCRCVVNRLNAASAPPSHCCGCQTLISKSISPQKQTKPEVKGDSHFHKGLGKN